MPASIVDLSPFVKRCIFFTVQYIVFFLETKVALFGDGVVVVVEVVVEA